MNLNSTSPLHTAEHVINHLTPQMRQACQNQCELLLSTVYGLKAAVIASVDGFDIASAMQPNMQAERLAAVASSIAAMSAVVSSEAGLGAIKRMMIDTFKGFAVVSNIPRGDVPLVLILVAQEQALLGQLNYQANVCCNILSKL